MGFDFSKFAARRNDLKAKGFGGQKKRGKRELWKYKGFGHWGLYVCPSVEGMDGLPFIPVVQHFQVGGNRSQIHLCLGGANVGLWLDASLEAIARRNARMMKIEKPEWTTEVTPGMSCPTCDELMSEESAFADEALAEMASRSGGLFNIVPLFFQAEGSADRVAFSPAEQIVRPWIASERMTDDICDLIASQRIDFTDPEKATILLVQRTGPKPVRYNFSLDAGTLREPFRVPKPIASQLKKTVAEGDLSLFDQVANGVRSVDTIRGWLGASPSKPSGSSDPEDEKPSCFGEECDPADDYCQRCPVRAECAAKCGTEVPELPKATGKPKAKPKKPAPEPEVAEDPEPEGTIPEDDFMTSFEAELAKAAGGK